MYQVNARSVLEAYGAFLEGTPEATLLVASGRPLGEAARQALERAADRLGYGLEACAWLWASAEGVTLGPQEALTMTEGIDPLGVVLADAGIAALWGRAYRCEPPLDAVSRVRGRTVIAFQDLPAMLDDEDAKQQAWALLKKLRMH